MSKINTTPSTITTTLSEEQKRNKYFQFNEVNILRNHKKITDKYTS